MNKDSKWNYRLNEWRACTNVTQWFTFAIYFVHIYYFFCHKLTIILICCSLISVHCWRSRFDSAEKNKVIVQVNKRTKIFYLFNIQLLHFFCNTVSLSVFIFFKFISSRSFDYFLVVFILWASKWYYYIGLFPLLFFKCEISFVIRMWKKKTISMAVFSLCSIYTYTNFITSICFHFIR